MHVGLALPQYDGISVPGEERLRWETVEAWAQAAEANGLHSVWLSDHLGWSIDRYGGPPGLFDGYDPIVGLAALARVTHRVRLGTLVLAAPLRHPTVTAKALTAVDRLSGGRLVAGVGAGWFAPDFEQAGIPMEPPGTRLRRLAEAIDVMRATFAGGPFDHAGEFYEAKGVLNVPPAVQQPSPPILVGGKGDRLIDLAARHADAWNMGWAWTPEDFRPRLEVLRRALDRHGRDPATFTVTLGLYTLVGEDEADLRRRFERLRETAPSGVVSAASVEEYRTGRLVGTVEQVREQLEAWAELGVGLVVACLGAVPFSVTGLDDLDLLGRAVREGES